VEKALESLQSLQERVDRVHNRYQTIEILVLQSVAMEKMGRGNDALALLGEALALAEAGGWIRPFLESGTAMLRLLNHALERNVRQHYVAELLAAFRDPRWKGARSGQNAPLVSSPRSILEPLTRREEEVLSLLAERLSDKEIATRLFVSAETVRSHVKHIYQKLQVSNRREAAAKAEAAGLLDRS
jgi:LuxR family maltose regulon positive regulatory protein